MLILLALITALFGVVYASFFEWTLHKHLMHKPFLGMRYAYNAHGLTHHRIFQSNHTYHCQDLSTARKIPMAWWNWMVLVPFGMIPFIIASWTLHPWVEKSGSMVIVGTGLVVCLGYYCVYEYIHWCMHMPLKERQRLVERSWMFRKLNGHHVLHHRYVQNNLNVVLPIADLLMGTYLPRAKTKFAQVRGPSVPDVQPL